jgi:hypothetical protein
MADAIVNTTLQINKGHLQVNRQDQVEVDLVAGFGPTPGAIIATVEGTDIDLSLLNTPGLCRIHNLDPVNYVQLGVWNPDQSEFYPIMRFLPGEAFTVRLDPDINEEYAGTGTGTTGQLNTYRVKAQNEACDVVVEAFEA